MHFGAPAKRESVRSGFGFCPTVGNTRPTAQSVPLRTCSLDDDCTRNEEENTNNDLDSAGDELGPENVSDAEPSKRAGISNVSPGS